MPLMGLPLALCVVSAPFSDRAMRSPSDRRVRNCNLKPRRQLKALKSLRERMHLGSNLRLALCGPCPSGVTRIAEPSTRPMG